MKKICIMILVSMFSRMCLSQINLVPNPSFEDTVQCPTVLTQINYATGWTSYRGTPDYFNSCASNSVGVPQNVWGFQNAYDGNAYALIGLYTKFPNNLREFIGTTLLQSLTIGTKYFIKAQISRSDSYITNGACNNFGFRFSTAPYSISNPAPIDNFCHYHDTTIILDSTGWTKIEGSFIADSAYQFLIVGNFYDDQHTDTIDINNDAGYYVDAICVSTDSLNCINLTNVEIPKQTYLQTFPNPINNEFNINNNLKLCNFVICDQIGQPCLSGIIREGNNKIDTSSLAAGMYLFFLDKIFYRKIIVQH